MKQLVFFSLFVSLCSATLPSADKPSGYKPCFDVEIRHRIASSNHSPNVSQSGISSRKVDRVDLENQLKKSARYISVQKDERKTHWANIVALCCGITTFLFGMFSVPAIVFGAIGIAKSGPNKKFKGLGMGITGLVAGILGLLVYLLVVAALAAA